jgi:hypothetical protein
MSTIAVTNLKHESASGNNITLDSSGNVGINNADPNAYATSGTVVSIKGSANNSQPAVTRLEGASNGAGFVHTEVYGIAGVNAATEISRLTGTGANGFRMLFELTATGHSGSLANGFNRYKGYWDGATNSVFMIEWQRSYDGAASNADYGRPPKWSFDTSTSNVLIIKLASGDGSNTFNGVAEVKYWVPIDFASSTYTIS